MPDVKISALPEATSISSTDVAPVVTGGITKKASAATIVKAVLPAPGAIGSTTPDTGAFTTLSASSTVSGAGFSTYMASPPAIGSISANSGKFTDLSSSGLTVLGDSISDTVTINGTVQPGVVISGASSGDALHITQTGGGNGLVVETGASSVTKVSVDAYGLTSPTYATSLLSYPNQLGSQWQSQYHANWNVVQTRVKYNPTEWQIYPNAANGIAQVISGTNNVVRVSGTAFDPLWVGLPYFYWEGNGYTVASVTDADHLTVTTTSGAPVSWGSTAIGTYYYCVTTVDAVVNTNGFNVTYVSGQPFIPICDYLYINGIQYTIASFIDPKNITVTVSAGLQTNVPLKQYKSIANELTNLRLQGLSGSSEENFVITYAPKGATLQNACTGSGKYRPIWIGTGENPVGKFNPQIGVYPNATLGGTGWLTLGGDNNNKAVLINQNSNNVNYFLQQGGVSGGNVSLASRGSDTDINVNFDTQGAGHFNFTSGSFGRTNFKIYGSNATSFLAVDGSTSASPYISAVGSDTNININLIPKGAGSVITSNSLGVGGTPYSGVNVYVNKSITGSAISSNVLASGTVQSDVTNRSDSFISYTGTQASTFTLANLRHFGSYQNTFGAGSTVTNQVGFFVDSGLTGATNNYGFFGNLAAGTGRYNLYMAGTAANWFSGNVLIGGTGGLGYGTGSGGAITQTVSRTSGVTLNKTNGAITLVSAAGSASYQSFTVTNSTVAATDTITINQKSGTDIYEVFITAVAAGSFRVTFATTGGTTTEQPVFNFSIIKAVTA